RGFLLKRLQSRFGFVSANTIQAVLFGMLHGIPFFLVTRSVGALLLLTLLPALMGWFEGWLNEKRCDGSIVPSWILHGYINFLTTILSL
ncbi:MAG: CPBP family intramembrane metalloprotease, partial [Lachnospiraceae bacterium]|nr:CPBP family intramembrane metalloprotease [Lachnospiraceae bacterium]